MCRRYAVLFLAASIACAESQSANRSANGGERASPADTLRVSTRPLQRIDTVVSSSSNQLGFVNDLALSPDGRVCALDLDSVRCFDRQNQEILHFGQYGHGPGEFDRPSAIAVSPDFIRVLDIGNGRQQVFSWDGEMTHTVRMPTLVGTGAAGMASVAVDGRILASTGGMSTAKANVYDSDGELLRSLGEIEAPVGGWVIADMKAEITGGQVPAAFLSQYSVREAPDGGYWLLGDGAGTVERYGSDGVKRFSLELDESEMRAIRDAFFARNEARASAPMLVPLRYFADAVAVGEELWVLLQTPSGERGKVLVVSGTGAVARRIALPLAAAPRQLVIDQARSRAYLFTSDDAQLLTLRLAGS